jgi:adenine-specific DNA-methyltransferase
MNLYKLIVLIIFISSTSPPRHRNTKGRTPKTISPYFKDSTGKNLPDYWDEEIIRTSVSNNQRHNIEHPAPFPINLPIIPILQTTVEGDLVLDPFMGSGTVGSICDKLFRSFVGFDVKRYL